MSYSGERADASAILDTGAIVRAREAGATYAELTARPKYRVVTRTMEEAERRDRRLV